MRKKRQEVKKSRKLIIAGLAVLALLLCSHTAKSQQNIFKLGASQTFKMLNPDNLNSGGTGFAVRGGSGKTYTMTNAHVCGISRTGYLVADQNGEQTQVKIIAISDETDLCITEAVPHHSGLSVGSENYRFQEVYVVGHPLLNPISVSAGFTRARGRVPIDYCERQTKAMLAHPFEADDDMLRALMQALGCVKEVDSYITNNDSKPGNSGSAVLDDYGKVVGVLYAGDGMGTSLIIPVEYIQRFLAKY